MEAWPIKTLKAAPISRKREIAGYAKSYSKQKKLLEIRNVAKKLPINLWQALRGTMVAKCELLYKEPRYFTKFT